jgi:CheY-like chemotaxis protein
VGKRVLVVDDDPGLQQALEAILQLEGYEVTTARDGLDALEKVDHSQPALILLDLMMPRMDGFTFAEELKQRGLRAQIPIIVLTADGRVQQKAEQLGADGGLAKPFDITVLLDEVARLAK